MKMFERVKDLEGLKKRCAERRKESIVEFFKEIGESIILKTVLNIKRKEGEVEKLLNLRTEKAISRVLLNEKDFPRLYNAYNKFYSNSRTLEQRVDTLEYKLSKILEVLQES